MKTLNEFIMNDQFSSKAEELVVFLRELSPVLREDSYEKLCKFLKISLSNNTVFSEYKARNTWGLCFMVKEYFPEGTYDSIFTFTLYDLYDTAVDPFRKFGNKYSYRNDVIDWTFRAEKALEIADHIERNLKGTK